MQGFLDLHYKWTSSKLSWKNSTVSRKMMIQSKDALRQPNLILCMNLSLKIKHWPLHCEICHCEVFRVITFFLQKSESHIKLKFSTVTNMVESQVWQRSSKEQLKKTQKKSFETSFPWPWSPCHFLFQCAYTSLLEKLNGHPSCPKKKTKYEQRLWLSSYPIFWTANVHQKRKS